MNEPRPYSIVAELTHRCPLACAYCSNPLRLAPRATELSASDWARALADAAALGVVQCSLTGGEPVVRDDLEEIAAAARGAGLYVNLVTSGIPLTRARLERLAGAGVDAVQLSVQDAEPRAATPSPGSQPTRASSRWRAGSARSSCRSP